MNVPDNTTMRFMKGAMILGLLTILQQIAGCSSISDGTCVDNMSNCGAYRIYCESYKSQLLGKCDKSCGYCLVQMDGICELSQYYATRSVDHFLTNLRNANAYCTRKIAEIKRQKIKDMEQKLWRMAQQMYIDRARILYLSKIKLHPDACLLKARIPLLKKLVEDSDKDLILLYRTKNTLAAISKELTTMKEEKKHLADFTSVSRTLELHVFKLIQITCGPTYHKRYPSGGVERIQIAYPVRCTKK